ncbi:hypothetical protein B0H14DRAFT_2613840 [Mycena olivaceomarginata]|nr:hypothetical protein B0H14DRAFT_2613840 [Mycena olivaceomarginata]
MSPTKHLVADAEIWINEGVDYLSTVQCPIEEASNNCHSRKDFQQAIRFNDVAQLLRKQTADINSMLQLLRDRSRIAYVMADPYGILRVVKEARTLASLTWSTYWEVDWLAPEAHANLMLGNLPRARVLTQQLYDQNDIYLAKTEYLEAKKICESALSTTTVPHSPSFYAHFLVENAYIGIRIGSTTGEILSNLEAAEAVYRALASQRILLCSWVRAELELTRGNLDIASFAFKECLSKSLSVYPDITVYGYDVEHPLLGYDILASVQKTKDLVATFHTLRCLADIFAALDDEETALHLFQTVLEGATYMDIHRLRAECMDGIGRIMAWRGRIMEAKEMWEAAIPIFIRSSQTKDATAIEAHVAKLTLAQDHQEDRIDYPVVVTDSHATANHQESKKLKQLTHLSAPQNSPSKVAGGAIKPMSTNGTQNATDELFHMWSLPTIHDGQIP